MLVLDTGTGNGNGNGNGTNGQAHKGSVEAVPTAAKAVGKARGGGVRSKRASKVSIAEPAVSDSQAASEHSADPVADRDAALSPESSPNRASGGRVSSRAAAKPVPVPATAAAADKAPSGKAKRGSAAMEETSADKDDRGKDEDASAPKKKAKRASRRG
jgi:hypothetical protein